MHFCINRACRVQIGWWRWRWWWWWWRWLLLWFRDRGRLLHADRVDPEGFCFPITFLTGATLLVSLEHVLTAAAVQTIPLQQFVHSLDDTLQTFVNIPPHLFLWQRNCLYKVQILGTKTCMKTFLNKIMHSFRDFCPQKLTLQKIHNFYNTVNVIHLNRVV